MYKKYCQYGLFSILVVMLSPLQAAEDWVVEEVLKQIAELKRDNHQLRQAVEEIKHQLAALENGDAKNKKIPKIALDEDFKLGEHNDSASVAIIEFSDFECPFCRRHMLQTLPKIKKNYIDTGKIQYVMRDFPLDFHRHAKSAAIAANCAGEQQAYWPMHEKLFTTKGAKGQALYRQLAKQLLLDEKQFIACLDDPAQAQEVAADLADGKRVGVSGTPAFFIGKLENQQLVDAVFINGAQSYGKFSKVIDSLLSEQE